ncbi:hypothetical protein SACS_1347 [Parasaccharibacter apium]|uniref:Uncharacterized protein n=1 Tax=Parasaccharibacter apium TaxID=1510841 RepID=A0A7U7J111_9PROT|nr:hypothetical protein SACS_1347 [Parasaccharibacter apium]
MNPPPSGQVCRRGVHCFPLAEGGLPVYELEHAQPVPLLP